VTHRRSLSLDLKAIIRWLEFASAVFTFDGPRDFIVRESCIAICTKPLKLLILRERAVTDLTELCKYEKISLAV